MNGVDQSSQAQIRETFQFLAPLLDQSLKLQPNPKAPKQRRTDDKNQQDLPDHGPPAADPQRLMQYLQALGHLVLRQEHSLSLLQSTDSFILFFQQDKEGSLQSLLVETQKWHQKRLQEPEMVQTTLRQHLCQHLLQDLLNRVTKVSEQAGGCPVPPLPGEESHPGGHELAFPALGHGQEAAGDRQEEGHHDAEDVGASDGAGGGISGPGPCGAIPGAGSKQPADGSSMETPAELALQQALRPAGGHDALLGVDGGGNVPEDSHTTTK